MNKTASTCLTVASLCCTATYGQGVLFDFENAPLYTPLPLSLTVDGITADFTATGQGFSIQRANTMGFTPAGFSGSCIYPSSVFASDLQVAFSQPLISFSILYAPDELACDSSAQMKVTAYMNTNVVGSSTMTADPPGTWPSATLAFNSTKPFNKVVVHYNAPPPTGGDYGPIFMVDNMMVTPMPQPSIADVSRTLNSVQFTVNNGLAGAGFRVLCSTNLALPVANWTSIATNTFDNNGQCRFTESPQPGGVECFYVVQLK